MNVLPMASPGTHGLSRLYLSFVDFALSLALGIAHFRTRWFLAEGDSCKFQHVCTRLTLLLIFKYYSYKPPGIHRLYRPQLFRHGARTPLITYKFLGVPNDDENSWPEGNGQLTEVSNRFQYLLRNGRILSY